MHFLGIDIGGTNIKYVVLNEEGRVQEKKQLLTEDYSPELSLWKDKILELIDSKINAYSNDILCGISAPGLVDKSNKMIEHMPERLQGIELYNWSLHIDKNVEVINDGHSAALAEYESFYKKQGIKNMLLLTLGTGVGGGIIIDGKIYQGNLQRAGHIGHMTVNHSGVPSMTNMPGSLEQALGNFSIQTRSHGRYHSVKELVADYEKGKPLASYWWLLSVQQLASAIASLANILSPELVVLGGGISSGAKKSLIRPLKEFMSLYEWQPGGHKTKIKQVKHGSYAGAIGAALFAKHQNNKNK